MARRVLSDSIWEQLQKAIKSKGCHCWKNDREIMEAILWKLRTGAPWRDVPIEFCPWETAYNRFKRWAEKGLWEAFFLTYEAKLIRSGYSQTKAMYGLINMRVESNVPLQDHVEVLPQRYMLPPMRMEIRSILKSLGVKFTTVKKPMKSSTK